MRLLELVHVHGGFSRFAPRYAALRQVFPRNVTLEIMERELPTTVFRLSAEGAVQVTLYLYTLDIPFPFAVTLDGEMILYKPGFTHYHETIIIVSDGGRLHWTPGLSLRVDPHYQVIASR